MLGKLVLLDKVPTTLLQSPERTKNELRSHSKDSYIVEMFNATFSIYVGY